MSSSRRHRRSSAGSGKADLDEGCAATTGRRRASGDELRRLKRENKQLRLDRDIIKPRLGSPGRAARSPEKVRVRKGAPGPCFPCARHGASSVALPERLHAWLKRPRSASAVRDDALRAVVRRRSPGVRTGRARRYLRPGASASPASCARRASRARAAGTARLGLTPTRTWFRTWLVERDFSADGPDQLSQLSPTSRTCGPGPDGSTWPSSSTRGALRKSRFTLHHSESKIRVSRCLSNTELLDRFPIRELGPSPSHPIGGLDRYRT